MIPGLWIAVLTFPGVIIHELGHLLMCRLCKVPVFEVCFFQFKNPAGYVVHAEVEDFKSSFLICLGPLLLNSTLCVLLCFPAFIPVKVFGQDSFYSYLLIWLGVSIGMHAFPSMHDANNLWYAAKKAVSLSNPLAILSFPLVIAIYAANLGTFFWLDYFYGLALGFGLPDLLLKNLMS